MSKYTQEQDKIWKKLEPKEVRDFLLTKDYFQGLGLLPGIVKPAGLENINLSEIDWINKKYPARTKSIQIITPKANDKKRIFSLLHPYSYIHLANEISKVDTWNAIKNKLLKETNVSVYSLPLFDNSVLDGEKGWDYFSQIDFVDLSLDYPINIELDIQNFYPSVYTHSISWAFLGKEVAKNKTGDFSEFANRLDKLFQNCNDGQTNGIPVGNEISNLVAEVILKDIDEKVSEKIREKSFDIKILRFRDDYKVLCKNQDTAREVVEMVSEIIYEFYGLVINDAKTKIYKLYDIDNVYLKHVAKLTLGKHFNNLEEKESSFWSGDKLFLFLNDIIDIHSYLKDKNYLSNQISNLVIKIRSKEIILNKLEKWTAPIFSLILNSINNHSIQNTHGFAILEKLIYILKTENPDLCKEMVEKIVFFGRNSKYNYSDLWIYVICKAYDSKFAEYFLNENESTLLNMIKDRVSSCSSFFEHRDMINQNDLKELEKFQLIDFEDLKEKEIPMIDLMKEEDFGKWAVNWYMSR